MPALDGRLGTRELRRTRVGQADDAALGGRQGRGGKGEGEPGVWGGRGEFRRRVAEASSQLMLNSVKKEQQARTGILERVRSSGGGGASCRARGRRRAGPGLLLRQLAFRWCSKQTGTRTQRERVPPIKFGDKSNTVNRLPRMQLRELVQQRGPRTSVRMLEPRLEPSFLRSELSILISSPRCFNHEWKHTSVEAFHARSLCAYTVSSGGVPNSRLSPERRRARRAAFSASVRGGRGVGGERTRRRAGVEARGAPSAMDESLIIAARSSKDGSGAGGWIGESAGLGEAGCSLAMSWSCRHWSTSGEVGAAGEVRASRSLSAASVREVLVLLLGDFGEARAESGGESARARGDGGGDEPSIWRRTVMVDGSCRTVARGECGE